MCRRLNETGRIQPDYLEKMMSTLRLKHRRISSRIFIVSMNLLKRLKNPYSCKINTKELQVMEFHQTDFHDKYNLVLKKSYCITSYDF